MKRSDLEAMNVTQLRALAAEHGVDVPAKAKKADLVDALASTRKPTRTATPDATASAGDTTPAPSEPDDGAVTKTRTRKQTITRPGEDGTLHEETVKRGTVDHIQPAASGPPNHGAKPTVEAGTVDPAIVERREARLDQRGDVPGRVRPVPASIDPRLVERRDKRRAERREQPATATPARPGRREV